MVFVALGPPLTCFRYKHVRVHLSLLLVLAPLSLSAPLLAGPSLTHASKIIKTLWFYMVFVALFAHSLTRSLPFRGLLHIRPTFC